MKEFEKRMKKLCPLYNELLYRVTKLAYSGASKVTTNISLCMDISTEVTVMTLAGYNEWDYPNDKGFLE